MSWLHIASAGVAARGPGRPVCRCADEATVSCDGQPTTFAVRAVRSVCSVREAILKLRLEQVCTERQARELVRGTAVAVSGAPRADDAAAAASCGPFQPIEPIPLERKKLSAYMIRLRQWQADTLLLPAVVTASAILPLYWRAGERGVFHDQGTVQHRSRRSDPFSRAARQLLPAVAPSPAIKPWGSCAVVGNSGVLTSQRQGGKISEHDTIVRINQAAFLPRYHSAVGNRTDVRLLNRKLAEVYASDFVQLIGRDAGATYIATRTEPRAFERLGRLMQRRHPDKALLLSRKDVLSASHALLTAFRAGFEEATGLAFRGGSSPSSGLLAIQIASQMCTRVDAYGFPLTNCVSGPTWRCPEYHYWRRADAPERGGGGVTPHTAHQYDVEGWLLKALHVMGFVCVQPPPAKLPPCGSRMGGLLAADGRLSGSVEQLLSTTARAMGTLRPRDGLGNNARRGGVSAPPPHLAGGERQGAKRSSGRLAALKSLRRTRMSRRGQGGDEIR